MARDTLELIDRSIADLMNLAGEFASEVQAVPPSVAPSQQTLRRKEALLTISVLLPKLAAAHGGIDHADLLTRGCQPPVIR